MQPSLLRSCFSLFVATFFALSAMSPAHSQVSDISYLDLSYTDIWAEQGSRWGVNFAQSNDFIFATFFVYDSDGAPKWYTGEMNARNGTSRCLSWATVTPATAFCGDLHQTVSAPVADVLSPSDVQTTAVGKIAFEPLTPTTGRLYMEIGGTRLTKNIQRLTLTVPSQGANGHYATGGKMVSEWRSGNVTTTSLVNMAPELTFEISKEGGLKMQFGWFCQIYGPTFVDGPFFVAKDAVYHCWGDGPWGGPQGAAINTTADVWLRFNKGGGIEGFWVTKKDNAHFGYVEKAFFTGAFRPE
ncbi:MAG: hypothetical protein LBE75_02025 [Burkholderiales bacterium]|jgi:hypothetical protein|nr:hypothetical protein [Burkholderiales bacterium]